MKPGDWELHRKDGTSCDGNCHVCTTTEGKQRIPEESTGSGFTKSEQQPPAVAMARSGVSTAREPDERLLLLLLPRQALPSAPSLRPPGGSLAFSSSETLTSAETQPRAAAASAAAPRLSHAGRPPAPLSLRAASSRPRPTARAPRRDLQHSNGH